MNRRTISFPDIRVAPAVTAEDWRSAHTLVTEMLTWLSQEAGMDAQTLQPGSTEELADMPAYYAFPYGIFLLGRVDGEVAGSAAVRFLDKDTAELKRVWVTPEARGKGLAPVLLARALDSARAFGALHVVLETEPRIMAKAVRMYRETGFREGPAFSSLAERVPTLLTMQKRVA